jgi:secreted trypsin-like serine protease
MISYRQIASCSTGTCYLGCGGTLINRNYILTAAHCITTSNLSDIVVIAGMHQQSSLTEFNTRQIRNVQSIHIHPGYNSKAITNDIALIRVNVSFNYTEYVQPACLPVIEPAINEDVIIIGWGSERLGTSMVDILKQTVTQVVDNCRLYWPQLNTNLQICVANSKSGDSACQGDSGGPILQQHNGQYIVSGVASYTHDCETVGFGHFPNVYTRVSAYETWIEQIIEQS